MMAVEPRKAAEARKAASHLVTVLGAGSRRISSFACSEDEPVLAAMLRARCGPVVCGCFGGGCGVCRMRVVSGRFAKAKAMSRAHVSEADERDGVALICCVKPLSDMEIEELRPQA